MTTSQGRDTRGGGGGGGRPGTRRFSGRRRRQCVCKEVGTVGYKDVSVLRRFISDRGRIESGRKAGNCAKCQRELSTAISRARFLALLPYAPNHLRVTGSIAPAAQPPAPEEESKTKEVEGEEAVATADVADGEASEDAKADGEAAEEPQEAAEATAETTEAVEESPPSDEPVEKTPADVVESAAEKSEEESDDTSASVESSEDEKPADQDGDSTSDDGSDEPDEAEETTESEEEK